MGLANLRNKKNKGAVAQETVQPKTIQQEPVYQETVHQEPVQAQQVYQEPVYQEPVYQEPVHTQPAYQEPVQQVYQETAYQEPNYQRYQEPVQAQPRYQEPVYQEPVYEEELRHGQRLHQVGVAGYGRQSASMQHMERGHQEARMDSRFQHIEDGRVYDRKLSPVTAVEVPGISEFHYGNPDAFGLQVLGLSSSEKVKLVKPKALEVKPIEISNIADTTGKVAAKLLHYMDRTSATVLPLRECGVFENITSIKGFKIIEIRGKKYASYCGSDYPTVYLAKLIDKIVDRITSAMPYGIEEDLEGMGGYIWKKDESRLSRIVNINGREVEVPALCNSEIEYICARFAPYNCNIIEVANDFPHIIVGVDLEGVGFGEKEL